jgi:hypothetical protein
VVAVLIILSQYYGSQLVLLSDGDDEDEDWKEGAKVVAFLGYVWKGFDPDHTVDT